MQTAFMSGCSRPRYMQGYQKCGVLARCCCHRNPRLFLGSDGLPVSNYVTPDQDSRCRSAYISYAGLPCQVVLNEAQPVPLAWSDVATGLQVSGEHLGGYEARDFELSGKRVGVELSSNASHVGVWRHFGRASDKVGCIGIPCSNRVRASCCVGPVINSGVR